MVNSITNFFRMVASALIILLFALVVSGCANINYQFGDISRVYCGTTNEEIRADLKVMLEDKGVKIGVDYCSSFGLVDAMIDKGS